MHSVISMFRFPVRLFRSIRYRAFYNKYPNIHKTSCIGEDGIGKGCVIEGDQNIIIGADTFIGTGSELLVYESHFDRPLSSKLIIGNHVRVTARCRITCAGTISIGNDTLIAPDVYITDHNHGMEVTIGAHSIIGAGGIVTRDIPPYSIAVGIPAKVIKIWNFERKCWEAV